MSRIINLENADNIRDIGGCKIQNNKKMKYHKIIRASSLNKLSNDDIKFLEKYGVTRIVDLRSSSEVTHAPDRAFENIQSSHIPIFKDDKNQKVLVFNEVFFRENSIKDIERLITTQESRMLQTYLSFIETSYSFRAYEKIFNTILTSKGTVILHCTAGKDRTGFVIALLMRLCGVNDDELFADYLLSNSYQKRSEDAIKKLTSLGVNEQVINENKAFFTANSKYLKNALTEIDKRYGSVTKFFIEENIMNKEQIQELKYKLTEKI